MNLINTQKMIDFRNSVKRDRKRNFKVYLKIYKYKTSLNILKDIYISKKYRNQFEN